MYKVIKEHLFTEENEEYTTYGVISTDGNEIVSDVTLNKSKIYAFVNMLNENDLQSIHLLDVIEDNLNELI